MSTSGTYLFNPDLAELFDEAFERIGFDPANVSYRHMSSAARSANLLFSQWITRGVLSWAVEKAEHTVTVGESHFSLPSGAIDIVSAMLVRNGFYTPMQPIGRDEYHALVDKTLQGRPDRYYVDRRAYDPEVYYWQVASNGTDIVSFWYFRQVQDVGSPRNTLDMPQYFQEAFAAGLAAKLAEKYAPEHLSVKEPLYQRAFELALIEDGSRAPLSISVTYPGV